MRFRWTLAAILMTLLAWGQSLTYEGTLYDSSGNVIAETGVKLKIEIIDNNGTCVLYERETTLDLSGSNGHFSIDLGAGLGPTGELHKNNDLQQVLSNTVDYTLPCKTAGNDTANGSVFQKRLIRITILEIAGSDIADIQLPTQELNMGSYAREAESARTIRDDAVTSAKIQDGAIGAGDFATDSVDAAALANNAVDTAAVQDGAVTDAKITAMSSSKLTGALPAVDGSALTGINATVIGANAVDTNSLQNNSVTDGKINGMASSKLSGALPAIDGSALTAVVPANDSVNSAKVSNNTLTADDLDANSVGSSELADNSVDTNSLQNNSVTDGKVTSIGIGKLISAVADYFTYQPNGASCATNQVLKWSASNRWECGADNDTGTAPAWGTITGIPADIADGDANTQLSEATVDGYASNNGYFEVDGSAAATGNFVMGTNRITGLGNPVAAQDAATQNYVDNKVWSLASISDEGTMASQNTTSYYNQTNMQTSGQSQLHFGNLTNVPAGLADGDDDTTALASMTGNSDNVTQGSTNLFLTGAERTKLTAVAAGAEVNVQSDWNAGSGDTQILNKPSIPDGFSLDASDGLPTNALILDASGNVGIGTTTPQSILQITGYTQLDTVSGSPPSADCDTAAERGRMKIDSSAESLWVCMNSGWGSITSSGAANSISLVSAGGATRWSNGTYSRSCLAYRQDSNYDIVGGGDLSYWINPNGNGTTIFSTSCSGMESGTATDAVTEILSSSVGMGPLDFLETFDSYIVDGENFQLDGDGFSDQVVEKCASSSPSVYADTCTGNNASSTATVGVALGDRANLSAPSSTGRINITQNVGAQANYASGIEYAQDEGGAANGKWYQWFYATSGTITNNMLDEAILGAGTVGTPFSYASGAFATSCLDYQSGGYYNSQGDGVYSIDPDGPGGAVEYSVFCNMTTNGGGWMLVLKSKSQTINDSLWTGTSDININDCLADSSANDDNCLNAKVFQNTSWTTLLGQNKTDSRNATVAKNGSRTSLHNHLNGGFLSDTNVGPFVLDLFYDASTCESGSSVGWNGAGQSGRSGRISCDKVGFSAAFIGGNGGSCGGQGMSGNRHCSGSSSEIIWLWIK